MRSLFRVVLSMLAAVIVVLPAVGAMAQEAPKVSSASQLGFSLYEMFYPLLMALTTWLGVHLKALLQAHTSNVRAQGVIGRFMDSVFASVKKVEGTLKAKIMAAKNADSDGGEAITPAEATSMRMAVWDELKAEYGGLEGVKTFLGVLGLGDFEGWVNTRIEAAVHDVSIDKMSAKSGGAPLS